MEIKIINNVRQSSGEKFEVARRQHISVLSEKNLKDKI